MDVREKLQRQREEYKVIEGPKRKAVEDIDENPTAKQRHNGTTPIKDNNMENRAGNLEVTSPQQISPTN